MQTPFINVTEPQLLPPVNARKLNLDRVASMIPDFLKYGGPFQPPGVLKVEGKYRIVWGQTRIAANWQAGFEHILVRQLPDGTTEADELKYSLIENHDRSSEDYEDVLSRIELYAQKAKLPLKDAACIAKVSPSVVSRWQRCAQKLSLAVRELAKTKKVGMSVQYLLSQVTDHAKQLELLNLYVGGQLSRDELAAAIKPSRHTSLRSVKLSFDYQQIGSAINAPSQSGYQEIFELLAAFKSKLCQLQKQRVPVKLLPEMLAEATKRDGA